MMKSHLRQIAAFLLVCIFVFGTLPVNARVAFIEERTAEEGAQSATVSEIAEQTSEFWNRIEPTEKKIIETKADKNTYMQKAYDLVSQQKDIKDLKWDDEDTFSFVLSKGMLCVYDYDLRMEALDNSEKEPQGSIETVDFSTRGTHTTTCTNTYVFGPYYGEDSSFTDYYKNLGTRIAQAKGGTRTLYSGSQATPNAIRTAMRQPNVCTYIFDSHGITFPKNGSRQPSSYIGVAADMTGVTNEDINNYHIISLSNGAKYGIDGYFMTNMGTIQLPDCFIWMAACESMMTYGLGYPFIYSGAQAVLGYSQSISFTRDYQWAGVFWDDMIAGKTVEYAANDMKTQYSVPDPYGGVNAYPIFMWNDGSGNALNTYPANPDSVQTVTSQWRLINNDPTYTVTFKDWDNSNLSVQTIYQGEDAIAPANPSRVGYTFTGWDGTYTNVTANTVITATYAINHYTVTFKDWNETTLKTEDVTHGSAATAPANPTRANYTFTGWDVAFNNVTSDLTVYAQYVKTTCTVTFVDWDGTTLKTEQVAGGGSATAPSVPERTGYNFIGWDRTFTNVTEDITVTAQYEPQSITVVFRDWNGTELKRYTTTYGSLPVAPYTVPSRTGYTFVGWDHTLSAPIYADTTFTAQYEINTYTVYFIDYNNTVLKTQYVMHGSAATAPANPTRAGYRFTGWGDDEGNPVSFASVTSNLNIYAQYEVYNAPQISVETAYGRSGQNVNVNILVAHNPGADAASFTISYDTSKLTYVSAANGTVMGTMNVSGNTFSFTNGSSTSANGTLVTITFAVAQGLDSGVYVPITITAHSMTNNSSSVSEEAVSGNVIINNLVVGDVNDDGVVNTRDAVLLLQYLAGMLTASDINTNAADINRNGNITTQDVVYLLKYCVDDASVAHFFAPSAI